MDRQRLMDKQCIPNFVTCLPQRQDMGDLRNIFACPQFMWLLALSLQLCLSFHSSGSGPRIDTPPPSHTPLTEIDDPDGQRESLASALGLRRSPPADEPPELPPARKRSPPTVPKGKAAAMIAQLEKKGEEEKQKAEPPPRRLRKDRSRDDASVVSGSDSANVAQKQIKIAKLQRGLVRLRKRYCVSS